MSTPIRNGLLQNALNANSLKIEGLADPTVGTDAANKQYVDSFGAGLTWHAPVQAASIGNVNTAAPGAAIDGYAFAAPGERVLLKNQTVPTENGLWDWQGAAVPMTRSSDGTTGNLNAGALVAVLNGGTNANTVWVLVTADPITIGVTGLTFIPFSAAAVAGNGLVAVGTTLHFAQSAAYTTGRVPFATSASAMGFDADLFWDNTNKRLGIGLTAPFHALEVDPGADRPAIRFGNTALNQGGYLYSNAASHARLVGGADWDGANWIARDVASSAVECLNGEVRFYANPNGLVVGNPFVPANLGRYFLVIGTPAYEFAPTGSGIAAFGGTVTSATMHLYDNGVGPTLRLEGQTPVSLDGAIMYDNVKGSPVACTNSDTRSLRGVWWTLKYAQVDRNVSATEPSRTNLITDSGAGALVQVGSPKQNMSIRFKTVCEMSFTGGADKYQQYRLTFGGTTFQLMVADPTASMVDGESYRVEVDCTLTVGAIDPTNGQIVVRGRLLMYNTFQMTLVAVQSIDNTSTTTDTDTAGQDIKLEFSWTNAIGSGTRTVTQEEGIVEFLN